VALDDNAIRSQKYTSIGRFQLFLKVFALLAAARTPASLGIPTAIPLAPKMLVRAEEVIDNASICCAA
jgi:hypothetical protein